MTGREKEACIVSVLLRQLNNQRLPRLFALKERLDQGGRMDSDDISYLYAGLHDTMRIRYLCDGHPDLAALCTKVTCLYKEITMRALANESRAN
jgi:hypothetical protein